MTFVPLQKQRMMGNLTVGGELVMSESAAVTVTAGSISVSTIEKVMLFADENANWEQYVKGQAPYTYGLATSPGGAACSDYHGFSNASFPNYVSFTSGSMFGITKDEAPPDKYTINQPNVFQSLTTAGKDWKWFAEDLPSANVLSVAVKGEYASRHVPPLYFKSVQTSGLANVVPLTALDVTNLPPFSGVTPNLFDDGHTPASVPNTDKFNKTFFPPVLASDDFTSGRLVIFIVTDNGTPFSTASPCIILWAGIQTPVVISAKRTHYDLLHQIEVLLGLPFLTDNDKAAVGFPEVFT
jgi:hypothetical protein